jgi:outer membrane protein assembly factor BamB
LFIQYDTNEGGKIITLNVFNGDIIWQKNRDSRISWASPILAPVDGELQLVLSGVPIVAGYNLENGNEIWSVDCMMGEVGPSPAYSDGNIFAANEYARLVAINSDNDYQIDWEKSEYLPEVASPVVSDNLLFLATSYGVVVCYDATTGEKYWEMECDNGFYSSPVVADGKVYVIDMSGTTHIMEVSKELKLVGEPELGEKAFATPAFDQNRIYIRGSEYLYCIGE